MRWLAGLVLAALCWGAIAQADNPFSPFYRPREAGVDVPDRDGAEWKEGDLKLPAYPKPENLIRFEVGGGGSFSFYVDAESIVIGSDRVVRYVSVARSRSGVESVSFDGLRCATNAHRVYATGRPDDKTWSIARGSEWKELSLGAPGRQHLVLMRDFFCPAGIAIASREEGVAALRKGFHPDAPSNNPDFRR